MALRFATGWVPIDSNFTMATASPAGAPPRGPAVVESVRQKGEVGNGVGAVHQGLHPALAGNPADPLHGEDLSGRVGDVADHDHARAGRDRPLDPLAEVVQARRR